MIGYIFSYFGTTDTYLTLDEKSRLGTLRDSRCKLKVRELFMLHVSPSFSAIVRIISTPLYIFYIISNREQFSLLHGLILQVVNHKLRIFCRHNLTAILNLMCFLFV